MHDEQGFTPPLTRRGLRAQVLLRNEYTRRASHIGLQGSRVLERVDDFTVIFAGTWCPAGWAAALLAPRQLVVKRTWRCGGSLPPLRR